MKKSLKKILLSLSCTYLFRNVFVDWLYVKLQLIRCNFLCLWSEVIGRVTSLSPLKSQKNNSSSSIFDMGRKYNIDWVEEGSVFRKKKVWSILIIKWYPNARYIYQKIAKTTKWSSQILVKLERSHRSTRIRNNADQQDTFRKRNLWTFSCDRNFDQHFWYKITSEWQWFNFKFVRSIHPP